MSDEENEKQKLKENDDGTETKKKNVNDQDAASTISLMKKGDYQVHILVEELKNLVQMSEDALPSPIVKLTCFNKSQRTEKQSEASKSYNLDEHFYFEKTNLSVVQLDSAKIIIEVYDSESSRKKADYYGIYEYDLQYIYSMPNHCLKNKWLALSNPESKDMTKVRGFLKLSISVLHDSDKRVELKLNPNSEDCTIPSEIKLQYKLLSIYLIRAEELPDMDSLIKESKKNRPCDPYVTVQYQGQKVKSSVSKNKNDVADFYEILNLAVSVPTVSQRLVLKVFDSDFSNGDDAIGSIEINIDDILGFKNLYQDYRYLDIYGISRNKNGKIYDLMNENAEIGSRWNGRILIKIKYEDVDNPITKCSKMTDEEEINKAKLISRSNIWSVYAKLYQGFYFPKENEKYSVKICLQENSVTFPSQKAIKGCIDWNVSMNFGHNSIENNVKNLSDIFIYLLDSSGDPICFQRIPPEKFYNNMKTMIIKLVPEPCFDKVKKNLDSGLLKLKICVCNQQNLMNEKDSKVDLKKFKSGDSDVEETGDLEQDILNIKSNNNEDVGLLSGGNKINLEKTFTVVCCVYMTRYLISGDTSGTSDPYVVIQCGDSERKTQIKNDTINGIWNEKIVFDTVEMDIKKKSTWPVFLVKVMDYDKLGKDDMLGYTFVWLSDSHYKINDTSLVKPKWEQLSLPESGKPQGEILLSFYILDHDHFKEHYNISSTPETVPYSFEINILGLRDLKPLSLLPIKKSFIKFDMNSMNVSGRQEDSLQSIKTQPKDKGNNPTINSVIKFDVKLPKEDIFMPQLQCEVYDYIFSGLMEPLVGVFLLNLKRIIKQTNEKIDEDMKITKLKAKMYMDKGLLKSGISGGNEVLDKLFKTKEPDKNQSSDEMKESAPGLIDTSEDDGKKLKSGKRKKSIGNDLDASQDMIPARAIQTEDIHLDILKNAFLRVSTKLVTNLEIEKNKNRADYFVVLPKYRKYTIPGIKKEDKRYKEYDIEDESQAPNEEDYFALGYIAKYSENNNPKKDEKIIVNGEGNNKINANANPNEIDTTKVGSISKHYRRIYRCALERNRELGLRSPFNTAFLRRGKDEDKKDEIPLFSLMSDIDKKIIKTYDATEDNKFYDEKAEEEKRKQKMKERRDKTSKGEDLPKNLRNRGYGKFKAVIRICQKEKMDEYLQAVDSFKTTDPSIIKELKNLEKYEKLTKSILIKHEVVIRVYVLELNNLAKKDAFSESDPYIKIYLGDKLKVNEQKNYKEDQANAKWYKYYDILSEFPGDSSLKIEVWDYDPVFKDELIGLTTIDLEDRYFNSNWQDMKYKPIEVRNLTHPDISGQQGNVSLWVEIFDKKDKINMEPWNIAPEPTNKIEMRLVIWETEEMKMMDVEDTSDVYVSCYVDQKLKQNTDVHYRCSSGVASFNWRIVIPIELPSNKTKLYINAYDKDIFSKDDFITGAELELRDILKIPNDLDVPIHFDKNYVDSVGEKEKKRYENVEFLSKSEDSDQRKFWIQCYSNGEKSGRILCSLEFLPMWKAELNKVGKGRDEPNENPYLPPPTGRFEWSLNPFKLLNQCVGPRFRRKMYCAICIICLIIYIICLIPYMIYHLSGQIINPFNYMK